MKFSELLELHPELLAFFPYEKLPDPSRYVVNQIIVTDTFDSNEGRMLVNIVLPRFFRNFPNSDLDLLMGGDMGPISAFNREDWGLFGIFLCYSYYVVQINNGRGDWEIVTSCEMILHGLAEKRQLPIPLKAAMLFADTIEPHLSDFLKVTIVKAYGSQTTAT